MVPDQSSVADLRKTIADVFLLQLLDVCLFASRLSPGALWEESPGVLVDDVLVSTLPGDIVISVEVVESGCQPSLVHKVYEAKNATAMLRFDLRVYTCGLYLFIYV